MTESNHLIVIGAGPGGYVAAIKAAQLGAKVTVIESGEVGGTCLNRGCIPTKALVHAAGLLHEINNSQRLGIEVKGISYDFSALHARKDEVVTQLRTGTEGLLKANKITLVRGRAVIEGAGRVRVGEALYTAENILIATGSVPARLPIPGASLPGVITSDELLTTGTPFYKRLVIVGGGVIGTEFAAIFSALGCAVTIVEAQERILPTMDREISQNLSMILKKRGVNIHTGALLEKIEQSVELLCHFAAKGAPQAVAADGVLIATGRRANTQGLLADGVELGLDRGQIPVDGNFETCVKGIYAIGDVTEGSIQLAHAAAAQGVNAVCAMYGQKPEYDLSVIPSCIYTSPEIAAVGITADQAKAQGIPVKTGKFIMSANGKSIIEMADRGFIKLVFHAQSDVLLGAQLMCHRASDMIGELSTAIVNKLTKAQLSAVIRPHPTFIEGISEAIEAVDGRAIHIAPARG